MSECWVGCARAGGGDPFFGDDPAAVFESLGGVACILEAPADFVRELSVIAARGRDGAVRIALDTADPDELRPLIAADPWFDRFHERAQEARADGRIEDLGHIAQTEMAVGDVFEIHTPGGGGYGAEG